MSYILETRYSNRDSELEMPVQIHFDPTRDTYRFRVTTNGRDDRYFFTLSEAVNDSAERMKNLDNLLTNQ